MTTLFRLRDTWLKQSTGEWENKANLNDEPKNEPSQLQFGGFLSSISFPLSLSLSLRLSRARRSSILSFIHPLHSIDVVDLAVDQSCFRFIVGTRPSSFKSYLSTLYVIDCSPVRPMTNTNVLRM